MIGGFIINEESSGQVTLTNSQLIGIDMLITNYGSLHIINCTFYGWIDFVNIGFTNNVIITNHALANVVIESSYFTNLNNVGVLLNFGIATVCSSRIDHGIYAISDETNVGICNNRATLYVYNSTISNFDYGIITNGDVDTVNVTFDSNMFSIFCNLDIDQQDVNSLISINVLDSEFIGPLTSTWSTRLSLSSHLRSLVADKNFNESVAIFFDFITINIKSSNFHGDMTSIFAGTYAKAFIEYSNFTCHMTPDEYDVVSTQHSIVHIVFSKYDVFIIFIVL